jgi:adenine-specific DNA-methyltransferase
MYTTTTPTGVVHQPPRGRCWTATEPEYIRLLNGLAFEVGDNQMAKREILSLFSGDDPFASPKPERLLERIIQIATKPGDLVLDSVLGSGTTAAVAHKMGRRYIGIEMGEHAVTHCASRLNKVI